VHISPFLDPTRRRAVCAAITIGLALVLSPTYATMAILISTGNFTDTEPGMVVWLSEILPRLSDVIPSLAHDGFSAIPALFMAACLSTTDHSKLSRTGKLCLWVLMVTALLSIIGMIAIDPSDPDQAEGYAGKGLGLGLLDNLNQRNLAISLTYIFMLFGIQASAAATAPAPGVKI
jgi:hypothetical protein